MNPTHYAYAPARDQAPLPEVQDEMPEPPRVIVIEGWTSVETSVEDDEPAPSRLAARHPDTLQT